jgi:hypothetical protein
MKLAFAFCLFCAVAVAADPAPRTVIPRPDGSQGRYLSRVWFNPGGGGCDIVAYHLFAYTEQHPDRVKYVGDDDVATVEGFVDYLATKTPLIVKDDDGYVVSCLIFLNGTVYTPWGQEIILLVGRKKDGYLHAFGERRSVNGFADPWQQEGFKYSKAVGITVKARPDFIETGSSVILPLNDNDYNRLKEIVFMSRVQDITVRPLK